MLYEGELLLFWHFEGQIALEKCDGFNIKNL